MILVVFPLTGGNLLAYTKEQTNCLNNFTSFERTKLLLLEAYEFEIMFQMVPNKLWICEMTGRSLHLLSNNT